MAIEGVGIFKPCEWCGKDFEVVRKDKKYCDRNCGNRARYKKYYDNNPDKVKVKRDKENSDVAYTMIRRIKSKCKYKNIEFNLDYHDIIVPKYCPVLGIKLNQNIGKGSGFHPDSPSLDRILPKGGYVKGNVRVISARANLLKNDATVDELEAILNDAREIERKRNGSVL